MRRGGGRSCRWRVGVGELRWRGEGVEWSGGDGGEGRISRKG